MNTARVHLRYRPASDVLSGDIELSTIHAAGTDQGAHAVASTRSLAEAPDVDSHLEWHCADDDPDTEYLTAFHIVHASARLEAGTMPTLPPSLLTLAADLVASGVRTLNDSTSALARVQAKVEVVLHLPPHDLVRPRAAAHPEGANRDDEALIVPPSWSVDRAQLAAVGGSLQRLASALHSLSASVPDREARRTDQLTRLLRELASVLSHGRGAVAPGTTAAARRAVRGGLPLTATERSTLRAALSQLDTTTSWPLAIDAVNDLASTLEGTADTIP